MAGKIFDAEQIHNVKEKFNLPFLKLALPSFQIYDVLIRYNCRSKFRISYKQHLISFARSFSLGKTHPEENGQEGEGLVQLCWPFFSDKRIYYLFFF